MCVCACVCVYLFAYLCIYSCLFIDLYMFIILYGSFLVLHMDRQKGRFGTTATSIGSQTAAPWCPKVHLVAVDIVKEVHDLLVPFHGH